MSAIWYRLQVRDAPDCHPLIEYWSNDVEGAGAAIVSWLVPPAVSAVFATIGDVQIDVTPVTAEA